MKRLILTFALICGLALSANGQPSDHHIEAFVKMFLQEQGVVGQELKGPEQLALGLGIIGLTRKDCKTYEDLALVIKCKDLLDAFIEDLAPYEGKWGDTVLELKDCKTYEDLALVIKCRETKNAVLEDLAPVINTYFIPFLILHTKNLIASNDLFEP